jgi:nucleotide-binding universal stress UspA family protein
LSNRRHRKRKPHDHTPDPVDGSDYSLKAVDYAASRARESKSPVEVHLLNVQMQIVSVNVKLFVSAESLESYYRDEGNRALEAPLARAKNAGLNVTPHIGVGDPAKIIMDYAKERKADEIVMGSHGRGALSGAVLGSVAQKVVHLSSVPVVLVK